MLMSFVSNKKAKYKKMTHYEIGELRLPIKPSARRKTIAIKQQKEGLILAVPQAMSASRLNQVLKQNHSWLEKRIDELVETLPVQFTGLHGECLSFLGQNYTLEWLTPDIQNEQKKPIELDENTQKIKLNLGSNLNLGLNLTEQQKKSQACKNLEAFFKQQAESYLIPQTQIYAKVMGLTYQSVTVKGYKSRWGSCYSDGRIQFNWRLMQAPQWVVDYVIVHELAHLIHANHSKAFWQVVETSYPQTKAAKQVIKQHGRTWIHFLE
ncbi:M48 family metallopeptidase [Thiomicrorhabdus sp. Milos-T2]|uniref:M48 family metallopeptidase n=1 Tax=Thiomicrorhabdus sp. Milos-T2 TaxID=90814 RepID=UPI00068ED340|nr:SprT family zinc-dependent metalloprotease [Thiomicrorhabdus sp. Milos-T2]